MKLSVKISALVIFQTALFAVIFLSLNQLLLKKYLTDSQDEWVNTLILAISESVSLNVINNNALDARVKLKHIVDVDGAIEYVYVTDFNGDLFVHTFNQGFPRYLLKHINQANDGDHTGIKFTTDNGEVYEAHAPLIEGMRSQLHIGINQSEINELIGKTKVDVFWLTVLVIFVGAGIAVLMGRRISSPLAQLSVWMNSYGKGDQQGMLNLKNADSEVANLINSFQLMIKNRSHLELELKKSNENLENRVQLRTQDYLIAKEAAENANQAKSQFLSSMSHELRTPLNAIIGFSQLLKMDEEDVQKRSNIQEVIDGGDHLLKLINEMLDLAKIESGDIELSIKNHSLNKILNNAQSMIKSLADTQSIQIDNKISSLPDVSVNVDEMRFKQVLLNILSNAIKYNSENGKVTIDCSPNDEDMLYLSITDSGKGLTPEQLSNLFKPFERFGAENSHIEGTGLGLVISKDLMEKMGGELTVESEIGKGSRFWIKVPLS